MRVDVQFRPVGVSWPAMRDATLRAEAAGYSAVWVFDHLAASTFGREGSLPELTTLLGALAANTTTIGLGSLVANVANRHPAVLAQAMATVQWVAGPRLIAGIGAGAAPGSRWAAEHDALGIPLHAQAADRNRAVVDQIDALRAAAPAVPIIVGVNSVALAEVAGAHADGINVRVDGARAHEFVEAARARAAHGLGRPFEISVYGDGQLDAHLERCQELGAQRLIVLRSVTDTLDDR